MRNIEHIPKEWNMLYFGGNHIDPIIKINQVIGKCSRTYTTSAYGIDRKLAMAILNRAEKIGERMQIDVLYSDFHRDSKCFAFSPRIAWQKPGFSDIQQGMQDYTNIIL